MLLSLNPSFFTKKAFQFLCFCLLIFGCNLPKEKLVVDNKIIITGDIETRNPKQRVFLETQFGNKLIYGKDNKFLFELEDDNALTVNLFISQRSEFPIFAKPGDSIHIEFNEVDLINEMEPPVFSGSRVVENKYLFELNQVLKYKNTDYDYFYNCGETEFLNKIDSLNSLGEIIITRYKSQPNPDLKGVKSMEGFLKYNLAYFIESYHSKLKYSFRKEVEEKSERFLSYQESLISYNPYLLKNNAYSSFLNKKFYNEITNQVLVEGKVEQDKGWREFTIEEKFEFVDLAFKDKAVKEHLKFWILYGGIEYSGVITKANIERFKQTNPSPRYLKAMKSHFSQIPETLREKGVLPNYTFLDKNDEEKKLYDFKGKILYIDLWATWCGPCLTELKYFEELIKEFEDYQNHIEFIGISLDKESEREKWKDIITSRNFEGIQLIAKNAFESEVSKDLKINGIPRFLIIGRDGELIQSRALRPRQKEIRKILMDLITES